MVGKALRSVNLPPQRNLLHRTWKSWRAVSATTPIFWLPRPIPPVAQEVWLPSSTPQAACRPQARAARAPMQRASARSPVKISGLPERRARGKTPPTFHRVTCGGRWSPVGAGSAADPQFQSPLRYALTARERWLRRPVSCGPLVHLPPRRGFLQKPGRWKPYAPACLIVQQVHCDWPRSIGWPSRGGSRQGSCPTVMDDPALMSPAPAPPGYHPRYFLRAGHCKD